VVDGPSLAHGVLPPGINGYTCVSLQLGRNLVLKNVGLTGKCLEFSMAQMVCMMLHR